MNIKNLKVTFFFLSLPFYLFTQGENNRWNINRGITIDFNIQPSSFIETQEAFFSIGPGTSVSDSIGNFLFHTNGVIVWNRFGNQMQNANIDNGNWLRGSSNASMPTLVIPFSKNNKYYIFSMNGGNYGIQSYEKGALYYSILDMNLDNGNGDIIPTEKNILLQESLTGRLIAGKGNCGEIWVLTHLADSNEFLAFKVTDDGISFPVTTKLGTELNENLDFPVSASDGMMKFSPDFKKLVLFGGNQPIIEVFDFNQNTGKLSNPISLPVENNVGAIQTGTFSPDNQKLYVIEYMLNDRLSKIFQFDFSLTNPIDIAASKTLITSHSHTFDYRNMELGPDGIIYMSRNGSLISGILSPNNIGEACDFKDTVFIFSTDPNQPSSFTGLQNPVIVPDKPSLQDSLLLPQDQQLCQNTQLNLQIQAEGDSYQWQDGNTSPNYEITAPGTYWVNIQKGNCTFTDTIKVLPDEAMVHLGADTTLCEGAILPLTISAPNTSTFWQDGSTDNSFIISQAGQYWVNLTTGSCEVSDTINVDYEFLTVDLGKDTTICEGELLLLNTNIAGADYIWQDGSNQATLDLTTAGQYWVEVNKNDCRKRDSILIETTICKEASLCKVFIPNTFSPNGDGINDVFQLLSPCELMDFSLVVYDRWGNRLFSTNDIRNAWDGTQNGQILEGGVYLITSEYQLPDQQPVRTTKTLTITR